MVIVEPGSISTGFGSHSKSAATRWEGRSTEYDAIVGKTDEIVGYTDRMSARRS